jgi:hypothetical protein
MAQAPEPAPVADTQRDGLAQMEALSDDEAEALLLEQLAALEKRVLL